MKKIFQFLTCCACCTICLAQTVSAAKTTPPPYAECATIQQEMLATMPWHDMSYTSCIDGSPQLARPDFSDFASATDAAVGTKVEIGRVGTSENLCTKDCTVKSGCNNWRCNVVIGGSTDCTYKNTPKCTTKLK